MVDRQLVLRRLAAATVRVPDGFDLNAKIARQWGERGDSLERGEGVGFATAEALAFGSLLEDGYGVRLTGQDSRRDTFSQRHAVVFDQATGAEHTPLAALASAPSRLTVADSPLTEEACLAFEYGYSLGAGGRDPSTASPGECLGITRGISCAVRFFGSRVDG